MNFFQIAQDEWFNLALVVTAPVGSIGTDISVTFPLSSGETKTARGAYGQLAAKAIQASAPSH